MRLFKSDLYRNLGIGFVIGAAIAVALDRGLRARRAVLVAAPSNPEVFADRFATVLGIPPAVRRAMQTNLERRLGVEWKHLHLPSIAARITSSATSPSRARTSTSSTCRAAMRSAGPKACSSPPSAPSASRRRSPSSSV